jgi:hypothetical protein
MNEEDLKIVEYLKNKSKIENIKNIEINLNNRM